MTFLITSGGTNVPIDSVRHIANMSSGRMGAALALALLKQGHHVIFFMQKKSISPMQITVDISKEESNIDHLPKAIADRIKQLKSFRKRYTQETFSTYKDYAEGLPKLVRQLKPDVVVCAAAVSDYETNPVQGKISSSEGSTIQLKPTAKVIPLIKKAYPFTKLVGFKLLVGATPEEFEVAVNRVMKSGPCDMVAANDLTDIRKGQHSYTLHYPTGQKSVLKPGDDIADRLAYSITLLTTA